MEQEYWVVNHNNIISEFCTQVFDPQQFFPSNMALRDQEYLVFGFISRIESKLSSTIPTEIKCICVEYYVIREHFTDHGSWILLNNITGVYDLAKGIFPSQTEFSGFSGGNTVYGDASIDPSNRFISRYGWTLKVHFKSKALQEISIGIDASNKSHTHSDFSKQLLSTPPWYAFRILDGLIFCASCTQDGRKGTENTDIKSGDTVHLVLDTEKRTLSLSLMSDDKEQKIHTHHGIYIDKVKYHLAIAMQYDHHQIQLISHYEIARKSP